MLQLLDMVETNELNRSLLTLLDENIANAHVANQVREFYSLNVKEVLVIFLVIYYNAKRCQVLQQKERIKLKKQKRKYHS